MQRNAPTRTTTLLATLAALSTATPALHAAPISLGWRAPDPQNTLVIDTTKGQILVEMHPELAPQSVARVKQLAADHVYDGLLFHRVIDHFVDQTGNPNNHDGGTSSLPNLPPEFIAPLPLNQLSEVATQSAHLVTGFIGSLPVAATPIPGKPGMLHVWGSYCAGVAGMGRQANPDSGNSEIFFMRDPDQRLDHDYAVWGRVIAGLDVVRAIAVGEPPAHPDVMRHVTLMANLPPGARPHLQLTDTAARPFRATIAQLRAAKGADFSVCDAEITTRTAP